jgi:CubicO group peptidase (beta-lactamase class C family)
MRNILLLIFLPLTLFAQTNTSFLDSYMKAQTDLYKFNGNVLVAKNGTVIYKKSFGYADYNTRKTLGDNSIFDCGSIAKEFTAMGILMLKDQGKIGYSDTIRKFFPELPYMNVTVQQLLTHTSGMPDGFDLVEQYFDHSKIASNDDLIRLLASKKPALLFKPGEKLMYSGTGFNILASIIEKVSGQSYSTYMEERIFKPLGMTHTRVANCQRPPDKFPSYAHGYVYSDSLNKYLFADSLSSGWPAYLAGITGEGMIITTTGDLFKWDRALKDHRLLTETTQQEMLSQQSQNAFTHVSFGYGMRVGANEFGNFIFHNGYYPGYFSMHLRYSDEDVTVIVLSNNESHSDFIADGLSGLALNKNILLPYAHKEMKQAHIPDQHLGKYFMQPTRPPYMAVFPMEFIKRNDTLYIHSANQADTRLKAESAEKYYFANGMDQQIEFETDNPGNVLKVWHIAWGVKRELKKVEAME